MPQKLRSLLVATFLAASTQLFLGQSSSAPDANAYASNPKYLQAMREGTGYLSANRFEFAKEMFSKANKIAGGSSWECLDDLYRAQMGEGDYKGALGSAQELETLAPSPMAKSVAEFKQSDAILAKAGEKAKPEQLEAAHELLQEALKNYPKNVAALFRDGETLTRMGKIDDAKTCFSQCASLVRPNDPAKLRAQHFAADPLLSLKKRAPAFDVTALDGTKFNLDAMGGRVVLIDFWATWCGPCNEALPEVKKLAKDFAGQPLVIISVSWDSDEQKWKEFIQKHEMTWTQYRDADHALSNAFGVNAIPHYFTIDSDGVLKAEMVGSDANVEGRIRKLVEKAVQAQKQPLEAAATAPSGQ